MSKGASRHLTFVYEGTLSGSEESPVEGLKVASIGDPISYLLYAGRWFPMVGLYDRPVYGGNPCNHSLRLPGDRQRHHRQSPLCLRRPEYSFNWTKPSFPGTIIAGKFNDPIAVAGSPNVKVTSPMRTSRAGPSTRRQPIRNLISLARPLGIPLRGC